MRRGKPPDLTDLLYQVTLRTQAGIEYASGYGKIFGPNPQARTTVEVARLAKDSLVEIDAIALE
jgi:enamine deaminase RidA (YjgF/YER057c/UK114 family)